MTGDHQAENLSGKALGGVFWLSASSLAQMILRMGVIAVLARLLNKSDFGLISAAAVFIGLEQIATMLGVGPALVQLKEIKEQHVTTAFVFGILTGLFMAALTWLLSPLVALAFRMPDLQFVLSVMGLVFPLKAVGQISERLLQREFQFRRMVGVEVISYFMGYGVVGVTMALSGFGVWSLVAAALVQGVFQSAIMFYLQPHRLSWKLDFGVLPGLLRFGSWFTVGSLLNYVARKGDNFVVGRFLGAAALGVYGQAFAMMDSVNTFLGSVINTVFFPTFAKMQGDQARLHKALTRGVSTVALIVFPPSLVAIVAAPEIVMTLLGPKWTEVVLPFQILAVGMVLRVGYKLCGTIARGCGAVYRVAWRQGLFATMVVGGALIGLRWGVSGVAATTLVALAVQYLTLAHLALVLSGGTWRSVAAAHLPSLWVATVLTAESVVICWAMRSWHPPGLLGQVWPAVTVAVVAAASGATYLATTLLTLRRIFGPEEFASVTRAIPFARRWFPAS